MIDIRLFSSVFCAIVAAGLVLLLVSSVLTGDWRTFWSDTEAMTESAQAPADTTEQDALALPAAERLITELVELNNQQSARITYLEKQRFDLEGARQRRENEANFERWYSANMPEECQQPPYGDLNVECINDKIRAKRTFMTSSTN